MRAPDEPVRRVLAAAVLREGESLIGAVRECARANRLSSTGVLLRQATGTRFGWIGLAARDELDAGVLAAAMRAPEQEIEARRHPAREAAPGLVLSSFFGTAVRAYDLHLKRRRFAPGSLERSRHHRALWHLAPLPVCPETGEELVDRCGRCGRRLGWTAAAAVDHCSTCGRAAAGPASTRPDEALVRAITPLVSLVDPRRSVREAARTALHPELSALEPGAVFDVALGLGRLAVPGAVRLRALDSTVPVATRTDVLRAAGDLIGGWPETMPALARSVQARGAKTKGPVGEALRRLTDPDSATPEQADAIRERALDLTNGVRRSAATLHGGDLNAGQCLSRLRIGTATLSRLVASDELKAATARRNVRTTAFFTEEAIDRVRAVREDCLPFEAVSERTGCALLDVERLLRRGLITERTEPAVLAMHDGRQASAKSFARLVDRIEAAAVPAGDTTIPLWLAARALGGKPKPWARVLDDLSAGAIRFSLGPRLRPNGRSRPLLRRVGVSPGDVPALIAGLRASHDEPEPDLPASINRRDAQDLLNLTPRQLADALDDELRSAVLPGGALSTAAVLELAAARISPAEVSARWGPGPHAVGAALRAKGIEREGPAGWRREAVLRLLAGGRRSA